MSRSRSGQCTYCGENFSDTMIPIPVKVGEAVDEKDEGTFKMLKPFRWRFLTNKGSCTSKFMCTICAEMRRVLQQAEDLDPLWPHDKHNWDRVHLHMSYEQGARDSSYSKPSIEAMKLAHLARDKARNERRSYNSMSRVHRMKRREQQSECHEKENDIYLQHDRRDSQKDMRKPTTSEGTRHRSTEIFEYHQEAAQRCQPPSTRHRVSRESVIRTCAATPTESETRDYVVKDRTSVQTSTCSKKSSSEEPKSCGFEKKDQRLSSTADILEMSRGLELPPNYFDKSSSSVDFSASKSVEQNDVLDLKPKPSRFLEPRQFRSKTTTAVPCLGLQQSDKNEEEEKQRRQSASNTRMLLRMRRYYDMVQMNGSQAHPATAPARRIRPKQRVKSMTVRNVKNDPTNVVIDLDYLRAYKDVR